MAYPTSIDAPTTTHSDLTQEVIHAADVNALATAVIAIETELGTLPKGGSADVKTRIAATETVANAAIPKSTVTTAGDLIYGTGSAAVTRLGVGAATDVLVGGASAPAWAKPPGYEFSYVAITSSTGGITATSAATAVDIVSAAAVTFDGATTVLIEFYSPQLESPAAAGARLLVELYESSTDVAVMGTIGAETAASQKSSCLMQYRLTPASGSRTYKIKAWVSSGTGVVQAGAGGAGTLGPAFIRITKVA